jgi:hypothetical protein
MAPNRNAASCQKPPWTLEMGKPLALHSAGGNSQVLLSSAPHENWGLYTRALAETDAGSLLPPLCFTSLLTYIRLLIHPWHPIRRVQTWTLSYIHKVKSKASEPSLSGWLSPVSKTYANS